MSWATILWWTSDLLLNFRTGYFADGVLEMNPRRVAQRYLKHFFAVDLTITLADLLGMIMFLMQKRVSDSDLTRLVTRFPRIVKVTKLLRLMNMLRIARFVEPMERLGDRYFSEVLHHVVNMMGLLMFILWLNHIFGCAWFMIAANTSGDTGFSWTGKTYGIDHTYKASGGLFQYFTAFHWALTQMTPGSMSVEPQNSVERIFNIACLILGLAFFSSVISSMTATLTQIKMLRQEREKVILTLDKFLRRKAISREVALNVRKQVFQRMTQRKPLEMVDVKALSMLSVTMRGDLLFEISTPHLRSHQIFRLIEQTDVSALKQICNSGIVIRALMAQDILFLQDAKCHEVYLITSGTCAYMRKASPHCEERESRTEGIGEKAWLSWVALWSLWTHVGTGEAEQTGEVLVVQPDNVFQSIGRCGDLRDIFEEYSLAFHQRLISTGPPFSLAR